MTNLPSLIKGIGYITAGILLILFVAGVPYMVPLIIILSLIFILLGLLKTNYHQTVLAQFKK